MSFFFIDTATTEIYTLSLHDALPIFASDRPFVEDGSVRVPVAQRRGTIAEAVRRLDDAGIAIDDISVSSPTLDDVFLKLTGRAAEPEAEEAEGQSRSRRLATGTPTRWF